MTESTRSMSLLGRYPYRNMFIAMSLTILAAALLPDGLVGGRIYDYMVAAILVVALLETTHPRRNRIVSLVIGVPAVIARLISAYTPDSVSTNSPALVLSMVFLGILIWNLLRDLWLGDRTTSERVFGALSAYLCLGLLFALICAHLEYLNPGSFDIPEYLFEAQRSSEASLMPVFTYFSFVTLTTLGYGDITPITEQARTLTWFEAFIGQIYLAVMVGGLVGVFFAEAANQASRASFRAGRKDGEEIPTDEADESGGGSRQ